MLPSNLSLGNKRLEPGTRQKREESRASDGVEGSQVGTQRRTEDRKKVATRQDGPREHGQETLALRTHMEQSKLGVTQTQVPQGLWLGCGLE